MPDDPRDSRNPRDPNYWPEHGQDKAAETRPEHQLPWPEESDPARLGEGFDQPAPREGRDLGRSFEHSQEGSERDLGRTFADPNYADSRAVGNAFADPNSLDDGRVGKSFAETNSSAKKRHVPLKECVHAPKNRKPLYWVLGIFAVVLIAALLFGWLIRHGDHEATQKSAEQQKNEKPLVDVAKVQRTKNLAGIALPGSTVPLTEAYVYARANGYLKVRLVDIGDHVRKGQLLAVIDAPDLDEQVAQAREQLRQTEGQLEQQKAQLALATVTVERYRVLVAKGVFSRQEGDQRETDYRGQQANVMAAQRNVEAFRANLRRVIALQSYEYVRAPFSGVVTQRNVDVGALISASGTSSGSQSGPAPQGQTSTTGGSTQAGQSNTGGSSGTPSTAATSSQSPGQGGPLFGIAQIERLRVLVSVPEGYVTSIHAGGHAQLAFQEYSGLAITGEVTRTANSVDPNTRTMLTEVQVDNKQGKFVPGMYTVVTFPPPPNSESPLLVSGDAIVVRHDTSMVATVDASTHKIRLVPVVIGRDYGTAVEILNGLHEGDTVVTNVSDDVVDNAEVRLNQTASADQQPSSPPAQNQPPGGSTQYSNQGISDQNLQGQQGKQNDKGSGGKTSNKGNTGKSESKP